jgi:predicted peptidase
MTFNIRITAFFATAFILTLISWQALTQSVSIFKKEIFVSAADSLPYRLAYPEKYNSKKRYPLVLFLHGAGTRGTDNELQLPGVPAALTNEVGREKFPCFIVAPQCPKTDVWVKFTQFPKSLQATASPTRSAALVLKLIDSLVAHCPVDPRRVYITGYSMGGEGTFDLLTRRLQLFAAAAPICSVADTAKAAAISMIPLWAFHGDQDDVNDVKYTRMMISALKTHGGRPKYTEYPGVKHNSWINAYKEADLLPWLFAQRKL